MFVETRRRGAHLPWGRAQSCGGTGHRERAPFQARRDQIVPRVELLVLEEIGGILNDPHCGADLREVLEQAPSRRLSDALFNTRPKLGEIRPLTGVRHVPFVGGKVMQPQHVHRIAKGRPPARTENDLTVERRVPAFRSVASQRLRSGDHAVRPLVGSVERPRRSDDRKRLDFARVDERSAACATSSQQRCRGPDERGYAREVADLMRRQLERPLALIATQVRPAAQGTGGEVVAGRSGERALQAVRGHGDVDRVVPPPGEGGAQSGRPGPGRCRDHDVCRIDALGDGRLIVCHDSRLLVAVDVGMQQRALGTGTIVEERGLVTQRMALTRLEQQHLRAQVGEQPRAVGA